MCPEGCEAVGHFPRSSAILNKIDFSFMLFNKLQRFFGEIETNNLTVSNSEIITLDFNVSKRVSVKWLNK